MPAKLFRSHHEIPEGLHPSRQLYRALLAEWVELNSSPATCSVVRRWGRRHPVLAGLNTPGEVVDRIDRARAAEADQLLAALIRVLQGGNQLAGRVLLQAMLPKLSKLNRGGSSSPWEEDLEQALFAQFWDVISQYPIERRPRSVSGGIALDTLRRLTQGSGAAYRRPEIAEVPCGVGLPTPEGRAGEDYMLAQPSQDPSVEDQALAFEMGPESDLRTVTEWGVQAGVISRLDAGLLLIAYAVDGGRSDIAAAAKSAGISKDAAKQRCSRARRRLIDAARRELAGDTPISAAC